MGCRYFNIHHYAMLAGHSLNRYRNLLLYKGKDSNELFNMDSMSY